MLGTRLYPLIFILFILSIGCTENGESSSDIISMDEQSMNQMSVNEASCQIDDDCSATEYCQALDPLLSPTGQCSSLQAEGEECRRGTACSDDLVCIKDRITGEGTCQIFPDTCINNPTCDCALQSFCVSLAGSSCSVEIVDNPGSSMTVTCAEIL